MEVKNIGPCKTAMEIRTLSDRLTRPNQRYILNTIQTILYCQQANGNANNTIKPDERKAIGVHACKTGRE